MRRIVLPWYGTPPTTLCICPLLHPGYTVHPTLPCCPAAAVTGLRGFTALTREVAELPFRHAGVTVAGITNTRFTVCGQFCHAAKRAIPGPTAV